MKIAIIGAGSVGSTLAMVWIHLARVRGLGSDIAFKLLRR